MKSHYDQTPRVLRCISQFTMQKSISNPPYAALSERAAVLHIAKPLYYYRHHAQSFSNTKRLDQLAASIAAINRALVRRGMDETHELRVEISSQAQLVKKGVPETVSKPPGEPVRNRGLNVAVGRKQSMKRTQSLRA
jgi:hypothetical protein